MNNNNKEIEISSYLKILKTDGEKFLKLIRQHFRGKSILDPTRKVLREENNLLFPIKEGAPVLSVFLQKLEQAMQYRRVKRKSVLAVHPKFIRTLKEAIKRVFPAPYMDALPRSYDIIGSIIIIEFDRIENVSPRDREWFKQEVAKFLIQKHRKVETIYEKAGKVNGTYRLRDLNFLWGKDASETLYKENGCIFKLDVKKTYFNPRLNHERKRIASLPYKRNELIVDLFAGVGPFSIQIAKNHKITIHAFDINPVAHDYLKQNIQLNSLKGTVIPHHLNVKELILKESFLGSVLHHQIDRIIMNLPEKSLEFMDVACFLIKKEGIIHNYQICEKPHAVQKAIENLKISLIKQDYFLEKILNSRIVKHYSPKADLIALDVSIKSTIIDDR
ncbi:MAG: class I SAM-dependent methyltransferase [Promethearchaeota archaeon]